MEMIPVLEFWDTTPKRWVLAPSLSLVSERLLKSAQVLLRGLEKYVLNSENII
jgi:hypothetical protein